MRGRLLKWMRRGVRKAAKWVKVKLGRIADWMEEHPTLLSFAGGLVSSYVVGRAIYAWYKKARYDIKKGLGLLTPGRKFRAGAPKGFAAYAAWAATQ